MASISLIQVLGFPHPPNPPHLTSVCLYDGGIVKNASEVIKENGTRRTRS